MYFINTYVYNSLIGWLLSKEASNASRNPLRCRRHSQYHNGIEFFQRRISSRLVYFGLMVFFSFQKRENIVLIHKYLGKISQLRASSVAVFFFNVHYRMKFLGPTPMTQAWNGFTFCIAAQHFWGFGSSEL